MEEVKKRRAEDEEDIVTLPSKKRGRAPLLGYKLDETVQWYVKKVRESGGAVSSRIVMEAARGNVLGRYETLDRTGCGRGCAVRAVRWLNDRARPRESS